MCSSKNLTKVRPNYCEMVTGLAVIAISLICELTILQFTSYLGCGSVNHELNQSCSAHIPAVLLLMTMIVMYSAMTGSGTGAFNTSVRWVLEERLHLRLYCIPVL